MDAIHGFIGGGETLAPGMADTARRFLKGNSHVKNSKGVPLEYLSNRLTETGKGISKVGHHR